MKKVLFVATVVKGHIDVFHLPYLKWFKDQGWQTSVCAKNNFENKADCIIPYCDHYYDLPFERNPVAYQNLHAYRGLKKIIAEEQFDIIHCHTPVGGALTRLAARKARKHGTSVYYTAHGFHFFQGAPLINWLFYYPVEKMLAHFTDVLIVMNQEDYQRALTFKAGKVCLVNGVGIDTALFEKKQQFREKLREQYHISDHSFVLLSVGELSKRKNHQVVIRALANLSNRDVYYVICGEGPKRDQLVQLTADCGLTDHIIFFGYTKEVYQIYSMADAFVFPSLQEGLPVAVMEAMSAGLPVIASNIRGNKDLVDEQKGGCLVENTADAYKHWIAQLVDEPNLAGRMGEYNSQKAELYAFANIEQDMFDIYQMDEKHR